MSYKYSISNFKSDVKSTLERIYEEEQSLIPIHIDNVEIQNLIEQYDENFPQTLIKAAEQEILKFLN